MRSKLILSALLLSATPAMAHVVIANPQGKAGSTFIAGFRVSHGCAGSPTTMLTVTVPDGIITARPQPKAGWTLSMTRAKLATPVAGEGGPITERVSSITWSGGPLPADQYDEFVVMLRLPDEDGTGRVASRGALPAPCSPPSIPGEGGQSARILRADWSRGLFHILAGQATWAEQTAQTDTETGSERCCWRLRRCLPGPPPRSSWRAQTLLGLGRGHRP